MTLLVSFCCNDSHGQFTGRVVEIGIGDLVRLACTKDRGPVMKWTERARYTNVQVGRRAFACSKRQVWVGNIYWDAAQMTTVAARRLVQHLLSLGWTVEEYAEDGPLVDLVTGGDPL